MVQSPFWTANWFAASQEIPRISQNPNVHYRNHKLPPPFSILGQPNPVHIPTSHLLQIHPNILSTHLRLGLPSGLFPFGFPTKTLPRKYYSIIILWDHRRICGPSLTETCFATRDCTVCGWNVSQSRGRNVGYVRDKTNHTGNKFPWKESLQDCQKEQACNHAVRRSGVKDVTCGTGKT